MFPPSPPTLSRLHACLFDLDWLAGSLIEYREVFSDLGKEKKRKRKHFLLLFIFLHPQLDNPPRLFQRARTT